MMQRRHFEFIARHINAKREYFAENTANPAATVTCYALGELAESMANDFENMNPDFNRRRFLDACGYKGRT